MVLAYSEGMSHAEICDSTAIPLGTVKSRLHEARRRLAGDPDMLTLAEDGITDNPVEA